jgi:hypothetical protein
MRQLRVSGLVEYADVDSVLRLTEKGRLAARAEALKL